MAKKKTHISETKPAAATTPVIGSSAPLFELARLLARHAARQDFMQREKEDERHDQAD